MRYSTIAAHLRPYVMLRRRRTTINHAFAAAVAPNDVFDDETVRGAIIPLAQDPEADLRCAYCGAVAETWDHIFATVKSSQFSGNGHRIGNLLPCCKLCNSQKGNKLWSTYLSELKIPKDAYLLRHDLISSFIQKYSIADRPDSHSTDHEKLNLIRLQVLRLIGEGDQIAARIRAARAVATET